MRRPGPLFGHQMRPRNCAIQNVYVTAMQNPAAPTAALLMLLSNIVVSPVSGPGTIARTSERMVAIGGVGVPCERLVFCCFFLEIDHGLWFQQMKRVTPSH